MSSGVQHTFVPLQLKLHSCMYVWSCISDCTHKQIPTSCGRCKCWVLSFPDYSSRWLPHNKHLLTQQHAVLHCQRLQPRLSPSLAWSRTYLCLASHFNTSIQKFIKVITEFARGCSQLPTLAPCGMDNFSSWLVQVCCCLVQFTLSFLKWLRAWRELQGTKFSISLCVTSHQPFMESSARAENPNRAVSWNCGTAGSQNLSSNLCAAVSLKAQTSL